MSPWYQSSGTYKIINSLSWVHGILTTAILPNYCQLITCFFLSYYGIRMSSRQRFTYKIINYSLWVHEILTTAILGLKKIKCQFMFFK